VGETQDTTEITTDSSGGHVWGKSLGRGHEVEGSTGRTNVNPGNIPIMES